MKKMALHIGKRPFSPLPEPIPRLPVGHFFRRLRSPLAAGALPGIVDQRRQPDSQPGERVHRTLAGGEGAREQRPIERHGVVDT